MLTCSSVAMMCILWQVLNRDDMDLASAVFAITAYVIADLDEPLPRK
jgi:hypothetical protein